MKLKTLFIISTIITFVFGFGFIIIPWQVYSLYGIEANANLNYMGQLFGAALIAIGLISWRARNAADSEALRAIIFSIFIADGIGFMVALIGQLNNVVNALGWSTVAIYLLLSMGFAYFHFSKPNSTKD